MVKKLTISEAPIIRRKATKELLPVHFTQNELQEIGLQLAATHQRIGKLTTEKKIATDRFKEEIDAATNEAGRLATNRVNGYEHRYVDCETTYDFDKGMKRVVRRDTGEVVREEPMKDDERQLALAVIEQNEEQSDDTSTH
jgi:hypothetical protein